MIKTFNKTTSFINNWFLNILIYLTPFINFYLNNYYELDSRLLIQLINICIIFFIVLFVISFFLHTIFRKIFSLKEKFFLLSIFFWLQFYFFQISYFLKQDLNIKTGTSTETILILFVIFIIIIFLLFFYKKITLIFFRFFFILSLFFSLSIFSYEFQTTDEEILKLIETQNKRKFNITKDIGNNLNIYFIILDGMMPIEKANSVLNVNLDTYLDFFDSNELKYIEKSNSVGITTRYTFASLFNLEPIIIKGEFQDRSKLLFPGTLDKSILLQILQKKNYNFFWVGNSWINCYYYNSDYCLIPENYKNVLSIFNSYDYILSTFLKETAFPRINTKIQKLDYTVNNFKNINFFKTSKLSLQDTNKNINNISFNDAIGDFNRYLNEFGKTDLPAFFFIHNLAPHPPFLYNSDCEIKNNDDNVNITTLVDDGNLPGYRDNYLCIINKVSELIKTIKKIDSESVILIQGDHGWSFNSKELNKQKYIGDRLSIFNLIGFPNSCSSYYDINKMNFNINALRFSLRCALGINLNFITNQRYYENELRGNNIIKNYRIVEIK